MICIHGWKFNIQWEETINFKKSTQSYPLEEVNNFVIKYSGINFQKETTIDLHRLILSI